MRAQERRIVLELAPRKEGRRSTVLGEENRSRERDSSSRRKFAPASFFCSFLSLETRLEGPAREASGARFDPTPRRGGRAGTHLCDERGIEAAEARDRVQKEGGVEKRNRFDFTFRLENDDDASERRRPAKTCGCDGTAGFSQPQPPSFSYFFSPIPAFTSQKQTIKPTNQPTNQTKQTTPTSSTPRRRPASTSPTRAARAPAPRAPARSSRAASTSPTSPSSTTTRSARASC